MSLLSIVISNNFLTICSDGQLTLGEDEVFGNGYKKFLKVNENLVLGFTGNKELSELFIKNLRENFILYTMTLEELQNLSNVFLSSITGSLMADGSEFKTSLIVAGKDNNGNISCVSNMRVRETVETEWHTVNKNSVEDIKFIISSPSDITENLNDKFVDIVKKFHFKQSKNTAQQIIKCQKQLNKYVSEKSKQVNNVTFCEKIIF